MVIKYSVWSEQCQIYFFGLVLLSGCWILKNCNRVMIVLSKSHKIHNSSESTYTLPRLLRKTSALRQRFMFQKQVKD